ncbi:hypothetical protein [Salegentibacter chungangensis]|uniref:Carboxypeptidase-like regulatory domain-containing protein n=1 Tax=Salegentibacter chungangensis TaxID=1335724 RepID=A0ABW3NUS4_9FLAO
MKRFFSSGLLILILLMGSSVFAQETRRLSIAGKVNIPGEYSAEGITVFNESSGKGTVTNKQGRFTIAVALNDKLSFISLLFEEFNVIVDEGVVESGMLNIFLNEMVTELPEVVVSPNNLSGYVFVDVARLEVENPRLPRYTAAELASLEYQYTPDSLSGPGRNDAMLASRTRLVHGLNFVNLFKAIVEETKNDRRKLPDRDIDDKVRRMYDDEFFRENLDIQLKNINDFIFYASDHGLTEKMLREGNELDLISFLIEQSKEYKQQKSQ